MRQIIAMGGVLTQEDLPLFPYVVDQARRSRPRVGYFPTASGDSESFIAKFYEHFSVLPCELSHLELFGRVCALEKYVAEQDVILVSGGNTKSMLAVWQAWGLGVLLRRAWEAGTVLAGFTQVRSAGSARGFPIRGQIGSYQYPALSCFPEVAVHTTATSRSGGQPFSNALRVAKCSQASESTTALPFILKVRECLES